MKTLYHLQVAKAAFEPWLTPRGVDWIVRGNFNTDFYGSVGWMILLKKVSPLYAPARHWYKGIDHMDQMYTFTDVAENWNELRRRAAEVADDTLYPPTAIKKMFIALGRASHSLTDIYAHSNYVELLYEYFTTETDAAEAVAQSGLPIHEFISLHAPTFTDLLDRPEGAHVFLTKYARPRLFTDQAIPDEGPRSHETINKDTPSSARSSDAAYPGIFKAVMALAHRDVVSIFHDFFDNLRENNVLKFTLLTSAFPGPLQGPGPFEKRAKFWSDLFGAWG